MEQILGDLLIHMTWGKSLWIFLTRWSTCTWLTWPTVSCCWQQEWTWAGVCTSVLHATSALWQEACGWNSAPYDRCLGHNPLGAGTDSSLRKRWLTRSSSSLCWSTQGIVETAHIENPLEGFYQWLTRPLELLASHDVPLLAGKSFPQHVHFI